MLTEPRNVDMLHLTLHRVHDVRRPMPLRSFPESVQQEFNFKSG